MRFSKKTVSFASVDAYRTKTCSVCGEEISRRGFAWVGHGRAHVRRNQALAVLVLDHWDFEALFEKGAEVRFRNRPQDSPYPMRIEEVREMDPTSQPYHRLYKIGGKWWNAGNLISNQVWEARQRRI